MIAMLTGAPPPLTARASCVRHTLLRVRYSLIGVHSRQQIHEVQGCPQAPLAVQLNCIAMGVTAAYVSGRQTCFPSVEVLG